MDYYKNDIFDSILSDHVKLYKRYQSNPYLDDIEIPETIAPLAKAIESVEKDLKNNKFFSVLPQIPSQLLVEFLLHNKRLTKKDNTRDFLIFFTLIELCKVYTKDYLVLISQDDIFKTNEFFKKILIREKISNLKLYPSIADFLKDFGPKLEYITPEILLKQIDLSIIEKELKNDIKCFPSYISYYYYERAEGEVPDIENLEIKKINVNEFYVVKDYSNESLKVNVTLRVDIKVIFQPERNKEELEKYLSSILPRPYSRYQNTFDKDGRPVFENGVLFIFEGNINEAEKRIENLIFIDFIPDYFIIEDMSQQLTQEPFISRDILKCLHEFDTDNGYFRNSRYGGGLSWHYRCKKCGLEYDTGEFFD